jgi:hypothetical protein
MMLFATSASLGLVVLSTAVAAQNYTVSPTITSAAYSTTTFNYSAASTYLPLTDFSNEQLALLWDQVGPVSTASINTTVSPTPEPSTFAKPGWVHPLVPAYVPEVADAQLPDEFLWGVASAAFQVEGAVNAEGKGPSVWDLVSNWMRVLHVGTQLIGSVDSSQMGEQYHGQQHWRYHCG